MANRKEKRKYKRRLLKAIGEYQKTSGKNTRRPKPSKEPSIYEERGLLVL